MTGGGRALVDVSATMTRSGSRRPRIAHVIPSLNMGGLEGVVAQLTARLSPTYEHVVLTLERDGPMRASFDPGVAVIAMGEQHRPDLWNAGRMARLLRALRPDIVHSRNWSCVDAIVAARLAGVRTVIHGEHGRNATDPGGRSVLRRVGRRLVSPMVTQFVTVSQDLSRWLLQEVGIPAGKVLAICNGVDTSRFSPGARGTARAELGIEPSSVVIGTVGRLDPVKDQTGLLRAFSRIADRPDTVLVVAGDGPCRAELLSLITTLGLGPRVRLLGERRDIPRVLAAFDIFVLCSVFEGISNTILEAMATGLPVVATGVGGNPELVADGVTGALVGPRDVEGLAAALSYYVDNPEVAERHGSAGRRRAESDFSLDGMVAAYGHLYERLLDRRRTG